METWSLETGGGRWRGGDRQAFCQPLPMPFPPPPPPQPPPSSTCHHHYSITWTGGGGHSTHAPPCPHCLLPSCPHSTCLVWWPLCACTHTPPHHVCACPYPQPPSHLPFPYHTHMPTHLLWDGWIPATYVTTYYPFPDHHMPLPHAHPHTIPPPGMRRLWELPSPFLPSPSCTCLGTGSYMSFSAKVGQT